MSIHREASRVVVRPANTCMETRLNMVSVRSIAGLQLSLVVDQPLLLSVADAADVSERRNLIGINLLTIEHRQTSERNDTGSLVVVVDRLRIRYYCSL